MVNIVVVENCYLKYFKNQNFIKRQTNGIQMLFFSLNLLVLLCGLALAGLGVWLVAEEHFYLGTGNSTIKILLIFLLIIIIIVDFIIAIENENQSSNEHLLISEQVWSLANLLLSSLSMYGLPPTTQLPSYHHHNLLRSSKSSKTSCQVHIVQQSQHHHSGKVH